MFDIGFWELVVIAIVALLVVGPERLPGLARKAGMWFGKGRRFVQSVKEDIDRELAAEELKRVLKEQSGSEAMHEIVEETRGTITEIKGSLAQAKSEVEKGADTLVEPKREQVSKDTGTPEGEYLVKAVSDKMQSPESAPATDKQVSGDDEPRP